MNGMMDSRALYPMKFQPVYVPRMWGGSLMGEVLHREVPQGHGPIGEAWELADREEICTVVSNGLMAGTSLHELLTHYGRDLLGSAAPSCTRFPLIVKLIDAGDRLSLQVHPDASAARMIGGGAEPKTEMWYVISARPGAVIMAGLNHRSTKQLVLNSLSDGEVEKYLQVYASQPGDSFYIPAGTLHAIGGGNLLLEIQQNSDTTFRLSDWGRVDASGKSRELHLEKGVASVDFTSRVLTRIAGVVGTAPFNRKFNVVSNCPFFEVSDLRLTGTWNDHTDGRSFHLITSISAKVTIGHPGMAEPVEIVPGESALIPACYGAYAIVPESGPESTLIKTTL